MSGTRCLFRPGDDVVRVPGDGAPKGNSKETLLARNDLGDFLDEALIRPLWFNESQQAERVQHSLNTMTRAERVYLEIEMQDQRRAVHSFDYDPIR